MRYALRPVAYIIPFFPKEKKKERHRSSTLINSSTLLGASETMCSLLRYMHPRPFSAKICRAPQS